MKDSLYAMLLVEFDGDTPREEIAEFTLALKDSIESGARMKGVVRVMVQVPELTASTAAAA